MQAPGQLSHSYWPWPRESWTYICVHWLRQFGDICCNVFIGTGSRGLLDNVLHALRALRPCDPRINAMMHWRIFFFDLVFIIFLFRFLFPGRFATSGSMIRLSVPEIHCTRKKWQRTGRQTDRGIGYFGKWISLLSFNTKLGQIWFQTSRRQAGVVILKFNIQ